MENAKLMQLEIEKKRKLPKNVKENINLVIVQNLVAAAILMTYFLIVNITYYTVESIKFEEYLKYFALGMILITVLAFEIAYRKKSMKICTFAIEYLASSVLTLYIPFIYLHTHSIVRILVMILPTILVVYYLFKSFAIFKKKKFQYQNNLSDVKEILKDTEHHSYLDEESTKTYRAKTQEEEKIRKEILQEQKIRKKKKQLEKQKIKNTGKKAK